ncbi:MAG: hypothetical protein IJW50_09005 [Clostridia bacterium]|nr:hypothetical protein [Clostridia bacterium]
MHKNVKRILMPLFCILLVFALVVVPLAWFAGLWTSGSSSFPFYTGSNPDLGNMTMWMYRSAHELNETPPTGVTYTLGWYDATLRDANSNNLHTPNNEAYLIPPIVTPGENNDQYLLSSLQFGKIDNLESLNPDNKIYFCFELSKSNNGSQTVTLHFDYADYGVDDADNPNDPRHSILLYNMDKEQIDHFTQNGLEYVSGQPELMQLLQVSYCVSPLAPGSTGVMEDATLDDPFPGLTFSEPQPIMSAPTQHDIDTTQLTGDTYYLYVCMSPKLENFGLHDHILEFFAQSYMLFDVEFSFEVH